MVDHVRPVGGQEAIVERNHEGPQRGDAVEALEVRVCVGSDVGNAVALHDPETLQSAGPAIAAIEKLGVGPALIAVDDGLTSPVQGPGTTGEFEWREWGSHAVVVGLKLVPA
jgi:hypothetical protein